MDITKEVDDAAEEFGASKYASQAARNEAMLHEIVRLRIELAAAQAREQVLRDALSDPVLYCSDKHCYCCDGGCCREKQRAALAIPANLSALDAALQRAQEEMRERCAKEGWMAASVDCDDRVAAAIRALEVKL